MNCSALSVLALTPMILAGKPDPSALADPCMATEPASASVSESASGSASGSASVAEPDWQTGSVELASAGSLAFGPAGVLFVADHLGAAIVALKLHTSKGAESLQSGFPSLDVSDIDEILAFLMGTSRDQIAINDLAVDPATGFAYLSATRSGRKGDQAAIVVVRGAEDFEVLDLTQAKYVRIELENAPETGVGRRNQRTQSITDLAFHDGVLYVAGLSNEEFASKLRAIDFPFAEAAAGTSIEIYHASHGAWETRAPVRAMVPLDFGDESVLMCGYTCTPLVRVPLEALDGMGKYVGTTVADLGAGSAPLDMVHYTKEGQGYLLIANSNRGVMKLATEGLESDEGLTEPVREPSGHGYQTIRELKGVTQLAGLDQEHILLLVEGDGAASLRTIELP